MNCETDLYKLQGEYAKLSVEHYRALQVIRIVAEWEENFTGMIPRTMANDFLRANGHEPATQKPLFSLSAD